MIVLINTRQNIFLPMSLLTLRASLILLPFLAFLAFLSFSNIFKIRHPCRYQLP